MDRYLSKEEYEEPKCLLNMQPEEKPVPVGRILEKLDAYLEKKDYPAAERHLSYWIEEAEACRDQRGKLTLLNERIGLFRKTGKEAECLRAISDALALAGSMGMEQSVAYGTTLVNAATGYKAFGKPAEALDLYRKARTVYESGLDPEDGRLGGLYNNMALALADIREYREAEELYIRAIEVMEKQENGELEIAITCLNLADLVSAEDGPMEGEEKIEAYLKKAEELLDTETLPRNGYYAFVCEKCAPVFGYYGYFFTEQKLNRRAKEIYERA